MLRFYILINDLTIPSHPETDYQMTNEAILNQQDQPDFIKVSRFQSIKTKILVFTLLATIIPALILGGLFYLQNSKLLRDKISHELRNATVQVSGKLDLWLNERLYDLRVFSSSYIITENLARIAGRRRPGKNTKMALEHISGYLHSVSEKFDVYEEFTLLTLKGKPVASGSNDISAAAIPGHWREQMLKNLPQGAKMHFEPFMGPVFLYLAETIKAPDGTFLGILVAKINLDTIRSLLNDQMGDGIDDIYLLDRDDKLLVSAKPTRQPSNTATGIFSAFRDSHMELREYLCYHGHAVVGMAVPISSMGWLMVVEIKELNAYARIVALRQLTILLVGSLIFFIGLSAYFFGWNLVRPVRRLSKEASRVAAGSLDVDLPVHGQSEVSYLTQVFNHMVASLRQGREELSAANEALTETNEELQQLSITDGLTGLYNRKHIMELFQQELVRARRYHQKLTILMLDIDHFKTINDTYGHQTGDDVLQRLAKAWGELVRECDSIGRYGGEEFLILLPESDKLKGTAAAERIRQQVSTIEIETGRDKLPITVSVGVSGYPADGQDINILLSQADEALYQSKTEGRNKVSVAGGVDAADEPRLKIVS